jgi:hypothetical protein
VSETIRKIRALIDQNRVRGNNATLNKDLEWALSEPADNMREGRTVHANEHALAVTFSPSAEWAKEIMINIEAYRQQGRDNVIPPDWTPTPAAINALPEQLRQYIHDLETNADPAGTIRELTIARDTIRQLSARIAELENQ